MIQFLSICALVLTSGFLEGPEHIGKFKELLEQRKFNAVNLRVQ